MKQCFGGVAVANVYGRLGDELEIYALKLDAKAIIGVLALAQRLVEAADAIVQSLLHSHPAAAGVEQKRRIISAPELAPLHIVQGDRQPGWIELVDIHPAGDKIMRQERVANGGQPADSDFVVGVAEYQRFTGRHRGRDIARVGRAATLGSVD